MYFLCILALSVYFGRERSILFDGADRIYEIVAHQRNYFPHFRFTGGINGIIPWLLSYLNVPFTWIVNTYIVNYCLLPTAVFLYLRLLARNEEHLTIYHIGLSLFGTLTFFHPNHDSIVGFYFAILMYSLLDNPPGILASDRWRHVVVLYAIVLLIVFTHIVMVFSAFLILVYLHFFKDRRRETVGVFLVLSGMIATKLLFFSNDYEHGILMRFDGAVDILSSITLTQLYPGFIRSLYSLNIIFSLIMLITLSFLISRRQFLLAALVIGQAVIMVLTVVVYFGFYPYCLGPESYMKPAVVLLSIVFIDYAFAKMRRSQREWLLGIVLGFTVLTICWNGVNYRKYYNTMKTITADLEQNTVFVAGHVQSNYEADQFYILPRMSAIINLYEHGNCYFYHYTADSVNWKNNMFPKDSVETHFCFLDDPVIVVVSEKVMSLMDAQHDLILDPTNMRKRLGWLFGI